MLREVYGTAPFLGVAVGFLHETCRSLAEGTAFPRENLTYSRILRYVERKAFSSPHPFPFLVQQHPPVHLLRGAVKEIGAAPVQSEMTVATNSLYAAHSPLRLSGLSIRRKNSVSVNMRCSICYQFYVVTLGLKCAHIKLSGKRQSNGRDFLRFVLQVADKQ